MHNKLSDVRKGLKMLSKDSKKKTTKKKKNTKPITVWVVAPIREIESGDDLFANIIGIYTSRSTARKIADKVRLRLPIKNLDYKLLPEFDDCAVFYRTLNITLSTQDI